MAPAALLLLAGCSSPLNQGRLIGGEVALDSVTPEVERGEREWQPISVVSLDRSNWAEMRFAVPLDAVEHQPTYTQQPYLLCETARQRGEYPSVATALDTSTTDTLDEQALEMVVAPLSGLFDVVMLAPRAIAGAIGGDEWGGHPWEVVASPLAPYERAPGSVVTAPEAEEAVGAEESPEAVPGGWPWEEPTAEPEKPEPPRRPKMEVGG